jgi:hypothetical protein
MSCLSSSRILTAAVSAVLAVSTSLATGDDGRKDSSATDGASLELAVLGTYSTGLGPTSAEIVAFDASKARLFVSNAVTSTIDIVDAHDPSNLVKTASIDVSQFGVPNSVRSARSRTC